MKTHGSEFNKQLPFQLDQKRKQGITQTKGQVLRLTVVHDIDSTNNAWSTKTTDDKKRSRYSLEDMLTCNEDTKFLLCINEDIDEKEYSNLLSDSAIQQDLGDIGGKKCSFFGKAYYSLKVKIREARTRIHHELIHGRTWRNKFEDDFKEDEGFTVELDGTINPKRITFMWKELTTRPTNIISFAPPCDSLLLFA